MTLDLGKAIDAGASGGWDRTNDSRREIAASVLYAALPELAEIIAEKAHDEAVRGTYAAMCTDSPEGSDALLKGIEASSASAWLYRLAASMWRDREVIDAVIHEADCPGDGCDC